MAKVLVTSAQLSCGPMPPHNVLTMNSSAILTVRGVAVLLAPGYRDAQLTCAIPPEGGGPCTKLLAFSAGVSTVLKVGGQPVVLETAAASTDATATNGGKFTVITPGQTILDAK
ncbi:hypothetical protein [Nocardia sp. CA-120079]|uniref:hypothetical protein n=1 Tax=Nocardia sp. CA-120079 TaxID=3239974 RepID=UPI003D99B2A9